MNDCQNKDILQPCGFLSDCILESGGGILNILLSRLHCGPIKSDSLGWGPSIRIFNSQTENHCFVELMCEFFLQNLPQMVIKAFFFLKHFMERGTSLFSEANHFLFFDSTNCSKFVVLILCQNLPFCLCTLEQWKMNPFHFLHDCPLDIQKQPSCFSLTFILTF